MTSGAQAPEDKPPAFTLAGYVKNMQTLLLLNNGASDSLLLSNLVHWRLNADWQLSDKWKLEGGLRTRIFSGDLVRADPQFAKNLDRGNNSFVNLSAVWIEGRSNVIHSTIDRAYAEYNQGNWEMRIGRQRINWGINSVWNPNDVFNAFSFTDFDYEERPGTDAVRLKYYTGFASSLEVAANAFSHWNDAVVAGMWKFNRWSYDFQLLTGWVRQDWVIGGGWAGNIKNAGFKGETAWFLPLKNKGKKSFAATLAVDYSFANGLYVNSGLLYNSQGTTNEGVEGLFSFELSAKNLYPYRSAVFLQAGSAITPLITSNLSLIYSPVKAHAMFLNPAISISVNDNWGLDLVGQVLFNKAERYVSPVQAAFIRLKFSY